jgi:predicted Zn-dependent peptidase
VLPSGLRVVTQEIPHGRSVSVGLLVGVGSRHEAAGRDGYSHLLEHLVFKGTAGYPEAGALSELVEGCGGSLNASTDRELTVYSARVPRARADAALEAVAELVLRPLLRRTDLTAEKPVVVDEIRSYLDSPGDHVFTLFDGLLFGDHPLGREIAGSPASVRRASHQSVVDHWAAWYAPDRLVLAAAGPIDHARVVDAATAWDADMNSVAGRAPRPATPGMLTPLPAAPGTVRIAFRRLSQGNLALGMPGVHRTHPDRWALDLLGAVLGDGMSSRLFLDLRERRSLVYDVSTFASSYADCGTVGVHAGFDPDQAEPVVAAILDQLEAVVQDPVTEAELERARAYTRGRLELRMEDSGAVAAWIGTGESLLPRIETVEEVIGHFDAVTVDDLLRVARRYLRPDQVRLAALGPFTRRARFEKMLRT